MVHLGTLIAVLIVFRSDIALLVSGAWRAVTGHADEDRGALRLLLLLAVGTVPAAVFGLGWKDELEQLFSAPAYVGCAFLVTGTILWLSRFSGHGAVRVLRAGLAGRLRRVMGATGASRATRTGTCTGRPGSMRC